MCRRRPLLTGSAALVATLVLTSCLTGERPTLSDSAAAASGDPAVDAVLGRLDAVDEAVFTASYEITNNFGPVTRAATVSQQEDGRRSVTVGDLRFLLGGGETATCTLGTEGEDCTSTIDDVRLSDLQVTHQFYGRSAANRLRTDAARRVGPTEGYTAEIAGQPATCVSVPVSGGAKVWCALDSGVLASYQSPDVVIQLTSYTPEADESLFSRTP